MRSEKAVQVDGGALRELVAECDVLIVAAGFEARARRMLELLEERIPRRVVAVRYPQGGISENDETFEYINARLRASGIAVMEALLDAARPDEYLERLKRILYRWRPDTKGEVWVDISALPMQGICATLAAVREVLPGVTCQVVYTEAEAYYPTEEQVTEDAGGKRPLVALRTVIDIKLSTSSG